MNPSEHLRLPSPESAPGDDGAAAGRLLQILWRGKWILLLLPALAYSSARWWLARQVPLYQATAQLIIDAREVNPLKEGVGEPPNKPRTVLKQQQQLLRSAVILEPLAASPLLAGLQTFAPDRLGGRTIASHLNEFLTTSIDVETDRLLISFTSPYHDEVGIVVDEALRVYLDYHRTRKREQAQVSADILRAEWERCKAELEDTTDEIAELRARHLLPAGSERTPVQVRLDNATQAWNTARLEMLRLRTTYEDLRRVQQDPQVFHERGRYWRSSKTIPSLEEEQDTLTRLRLEKEDELRRKEQKYGSAHPDLARLGGEIVELQARADEVALAYAQDWLRTAEISFREAEQLERSLAEDVRSLESELVETNLVLARIDDLERERNVLLEVIGRFGERITDLGILDQTGGLNLHQLETRTYARPVYPDEEAALVYALGGSIILAFALVLVRGLSDRRVREVQQVPALLGTSVLGVLPELSGLGRGRLARLVEEQPDSLPAEAIRSARTATNFALPEDGRGVVLVTSAASGEGKSVCASNLAFALARAGKKTLLVDGDLRRPAQHEIYGVPNRNGLADLLASSLALRKALVPNVAVGLDLLCAGEARGRASELCEGPILPELIASLRQQYEVVLIDGPPVLESSEARVVATLSDAVVFVLRLEHSTAPAARRALGILRGRGARLLGTLVNGARSKKGARDYAGGISYGDPETAPRRARAAEGEAERGPEPERGRGTDFLGLEEESA